MDLVDPLSWSSGSEKPKPTTEIPSASSLFSSDTTELDLTPVAEEEPRPSLSELDPSTGNGEEEVYIPGLTNETLFGGDLPPVSYS
jgi:hypothetical protein